MFFDRVTESLGSVAVGLQSQNRAYYHLLKAHGATDQQQRLEYEAYLDQYTNG
jgi:hypothetical protein